MSQWITTKKRKQIYVRDNHTCLYCGDSIYDTADLVLTLDHIVPRVLGGHNMQDNLVTACRECNSSKKDRPLKQFLQVLSDRGVDTTKIAKNIKNAVRRKLK